MQSSGGNHHAKKGARRVTGAGKVQTVGGTDAPLLQEASRGVDADTPSGRVNTAEAIRLAINNHPRAGAAELRRLFAEEGVQASSAETEAVQSQTKGGGQAVARQGGGRPMGENGRKPRG